MSLQPFKHVEPKSVDEAAAIATQHKERMALIAGGTDLLGVLKDNIFPGFPEVLVDLKKISNLSYVREDQAGLKIGALTTIHEIETNETVKKKYSLLAEAAASVASPQIRNMGTIAGNICQQPRCWYFRYPQNFFNCIRKGGTKCEAIVGENQYHSIFGAAHIVTPPCSTNCPGNIDVPSYLSRIRRGALLEAADILMERNPLPAITGRVCPHFCEPACNRSGFDEAVSIRGIERFIGDYVLDHSSDIIKPPVRDTGKSVAIVGSGPAGLSAAYYLRRMGDQVTIFDKMKEAGGMLTYGVPPFRLPKDLVRKQITFLKSMGVKFKLTVNVGPDVSLEKLKSEFDSVLLASGAGLQRTLGIDREELLMSGLEFLTKVIDGLRKAPGKKVLVIGGGAVAIAVASTAQRLGSQQVTMACLERLDEMPAAYSCPDDVKTASEEGLVIMSSWAPVKVLETGGKISGMELVRCTSVFDDKGAFHPTLDPSVRKTVEADQVILAIGQAADLSYVNKSLKIERGLIVVDKNTQATNVSGVFASGDVTTGTAYIITAIAAGRRAALHINSYLKGTEWIDKRSSEKPGSLLELNSEYLKQTQRAKVLCLSQSERSLEKEDARGLDLDMVEMEANRCFNCGCLAVNASDMALALVALAAKIKTDKRVLDAEEFFEAGPLTSTVIDVDELVTEIEVPTPEAGTKQIFLKFRLRSSFDFPIASVAAALILKGNKVVDARIVLGAVAPVPLRAKEAEEFLRGKTLSEEVAEAARALAVKQTIPLPKNAYKVQIAGALVREAILFQP